MPDVVPDAMRHLVLGVVIVYRKRADGAHEFLLVKRSSKLKIFPGLWGLTGGSFEESDCDFLPQEYGDWEEPLEATARREAREEIGLVFGPMRYVNHSRFVRKDGVPAVVLRFAAQYPGGKIVLNEEHTEYAWVSAKEVDAYHCINNVAASVKYLDEQLREEVA